MSADARFPASRFLYLFTSAIPHRVSHRTMPISSAKRLEYPVVVRPARWVCLHLYHTFRGVLYCFLCILPCLPGLGRLAFSFLSHRSRPPPATSPTDAASTMEICDRPQSPPLSSLPARLLGSVGNMSLSLGLHKSDVVDGQRFTLLVDAKIHRDARGRWETCDAESLEPVGLVDYVIPACSGNLQHNIIAEPWLMRCQSD